MMELQGLLIGRGKKKKKKKKVLVNWLNCADILDLPFYRSRYAKRCYKTTSKSKRLRVPDNHACMVCSYWAKE